MSWTGDLVRTSVIVANRTVAGAELQHAVRSRVADGTCTFHLVVPIARPVSPALAVGAAAADMMPLGTVDDRDERQLAAEQLRIGIEWLQTIGATATGELAGDADTAKAVAGVVERVGADEIIVSTLPSTISRWLRQDLPTRIERKVEVPVTVITGAA